MLICSKCANIYRYERIVDLCGVTIIILQRNVKYVYYIPDFFGKKLIYVIIYCYSLQNLYFSQNLPERAIFRLIPIKNVNVASSKTYIKFVDFFHTIGYNIN